MLKLKLCGFGVLFINFFVVTVFANTCTTTTAQVAHSAPDESIYVLDTNLFHNDPEILTRLNSKHVIIPAAVIDELDRHKEERLTDRSFTARIASAEIKRLISTSNAVHNIPLAGGGDLSLIDVTANFKWPQGFNPEKADHRILAVAKELQDHNPGRKVIMCSGDNNVFIRARTLGLQTDDLAAEVDPQTVKELTEGPLTLQVSGEILDRLDSLDKKTISRKEAVSFGIPSTRALYDNQFVVFAHDAPADHEQFDLGVALNRVWRFRRNAESGDHFIPVRKGEIAKLAVGPRNMEQIMTLDLLLDPKIHLVTLSGKAGTGKTLLTLMAGLAQSPLLSKRSQFDQINLTRPNQMTGPEMGFLPGTLDEKMDPLLQPFYDNFQVIIEEMRKGSSTSPRQFKNSVLAGESPKGSLGKDLDLSDFLSHKTTPEGMVERLKKSPFLKKIPLAYSRGRSLRDVLLIVDEGQNLTLHEVRTIITRAGEGTKVVLLGDVFQIDHPKLNRSNNGLAIVLSRFKDKGLAGHVNLVEGERSPLATMASELLQ